MGEGTNRLKSLPRHPAEDKNPKVATRELESEIEEVRRSLDRSLAELDRRRHEATDLKLQIRRHPGIVVGVGVGAVLLVGGLVAFAVVARRRERPVSRARQIGLAMRRGYRHPEKVARPEPSVAFKVLAAIATTAGTTIAKKLIEQAWKKPTWSPGSAPAVAAP